MKLASQKCLVQVNCSKDISFWSFDKKSNFTPVFILNKYFLAWNLCKTFACINFFVCWRKILKLGESSIDARI